MRAYINQALVALTMLVSIALSIVPAQTTQEISRDSMTSFAVEGWGVNLGDGDPAVKRGDDFYLSQNGGWIARKSDQVKGAYWRDLRRLAIRHLDTLLRDAGANTTTIPNSPEGIAGAFYRSYIDEKTIEAKGVTPLKPQLDAIRQVKTRSQLAELMGNEAGPGAQRGINPIS